MGAHRVVVTGTEGWVQKEKLAGEMDFIISVRCLARSDVPSITYPSGVPPLFSRPSTSPQA